MSPDQGGGGREKRQRGTERGERENSKGIRGLKDNRKGKQGLKKEEQKTKRIRIKGDSEERVK